MVTDTDVIMDCLTWKQIGHLGEFGGCFCNFQGFKLSEEAGAGGHGGHTHPEPAGEDS